VISPLYAAWLACIAIYSELGAFDEVLTVEPDTIGLKSIADTLTITAQGTRDVEMWESNFRIREFADPVFGQVHSGFRDAALAIYPQIKQKAAQAIAEGKRVSLKGHSRGAALAQYLAALSAQDGIPVTLFLFESPNVGYQQFADICATYAKAGLIDCQISTVNGLDPVPYVPIEPYVKTYPTIDLDEAPGGLEDADIFDWHIGRTIYAGMQKKFPN